MATNLEEMIEEQIKARGIVNPKVLEALANVDRADFVPEVERNNAYADRPLPIGEGQTISQPYIVAYMTEQLNLKPEAKVLEIGTGCGYNAAVLSKLVSKVYSIEIIDWLAEFGRENLHKNGVTNVTVKNADGYNGWQEQAPFDAIILTASPPYIPEPLKTQLKIGGKLIAPVGQQVQNLQLIERTDQDRYKESTLLLVNFVPMKGEAQDKYIRP